jgi:hypothetical protein
MSQKQSLEKDESTLRTRTKNSEKYVPHMQPQTLSLQNVQGCDQFHGAVNKVNTSECTGVSWKRSEDCTKSQGCEEGSR